MDWLTRMNAAMDYIENNLAGKVIIERAANIACCSVFHYQKMFSLATDVPLMEYIRRRRLSLAVFDLQNTNNKIIDIAHKYDYESHAAFSRAFQSLHGVSPTFARTKGVYLKSYPRIYFHLTLRGDTAMNYKIEHRKTFSIFGKSARFRRAEDAFIKIPQLWDAWVNDGTAEKILVDAGKKLPTTIKDGVYGSIDMLLYGAVDASQYDSIGYMICQMKPDTSISNEFEVLNVPELDWVVFSSEAVSAEDATTAAQDLWEYERRWFLENPEYEHAQTPSFEMTYHAGKGLFKCELLIAVIRK